MAKAGLIHDYDLMANREQSSQGVTCAICDTPNTRFQWSDLNGEAMCCTCGCPYQLVNGSDEQRAEGKYPYLSMRDDFVPAAREFWNATRTWVHYGCSFSRNDGHPALSEWLKEHHPEHLNAEES